MEFSMLVASIGARIWSSDSRSDAKGTHRGENLELKLSLRCSAHAYTYGHPFSPDLLGEGILSARTGMRSRIGQELKNRYANVYVGV